MIKNKINKNILEVFRSLYRESTSDQ